MVFDVKMHTMEDDEFTQDYNDTNYTLPFCQEFWPSKFHEIAYFSLIDVTACYILPLVLIIVCNVITWQNVKNTTLAQSNVEHEQPFNLRHLQRQKMLRVLKLFTFLTFSFFICWLPLYLVVGRIKIVYTEDDNGSEWEQQFISILLPIVQLLGSCNSCVNPVLYALLNQTFREGFQKAFSCFNCLKKSSRVHSCVQIGQIKNNVVGIREKNCEKTGSIVAIN